MKLKEIFETVAPNKAPAEDMGNAADDALQSKLGTYAALKPNQKTVEAIKRFTQDIELTNPVDPDTLHATILYSPKFLPNYHAKGTLDKPYIGINLQTSIWTTQSGSSALVIMFACPDLEKYHEQLMTDHQAEYPFDQYIPHITISYDLDGDSYDTDTLTYELANYLDHVELDQEYEAPLNVAGDEPEDDEPIEDTEAPADQAAANS